MLPGMRGDRFRLIGRRWLALFLALAAWPVGEIAFAALAIHREPIERCGAPLAEASVPFTLYLGVIAQEDTRFYAHRGIDWPLVWLNARQNLRQGRIAGGASTIDMQVAALCHVNATTGNRWLRKLRQALYAAMLNRVRGKQDILSAYLSAAPLIPGGPVGFESGARHYFGTELRLLDTSQQWGLIVALRNRETLNPFAVAAAGGLPESIEQQTRRARQRQQDMLRRFRERAIR